MSPSHSRKLQPHIVLNDIFKNKGIVAKRKNMLTAVSASWSQISADLDRRIASAAQRARRYENRSARVQPSTDNKTDISNPSTHREPAKTNAVAITKRRGRPRKVDKEVVVNAILKNKKNILRDDGKLEFSSHPGWVDVKNELDNKISITSIYKTAKTEDVYKLLTDEDKKNVPRVPAEDTAAVATPTRHDNNTMVFEHAVLNLVKAVDNLSKEIAELRKDLRQHDISV